MMRTQILLMEAQAQELRKLAAVERRSMADLVRDGVDAMLKAHAGGRRDHAKARALAAAGRFRSGVPDLGTRHDDHLAQARKP
ncbi:MAG: CopG family transcriptional regulator [Acidobacteria bacterium]|nr:CopG family transcriptional regulator [Acidobacteriota bacterium]